MEMARSVMGSDPFTEMLQAPPKRNEVVMGSDPISAIYTTEYDDSYVLEPIVASDLQEFRELVKNQQERSIESDFDYDLVDIKAGFIINERMTRIRKLNRKIGENLKLLYGYRCQLCGQLIGEEFGAHIAEAHHIDYYVKSLNNDSNNQMVVCPNHHSIIHEADPKFDRKRMMFLYPNGMEQKVVLNRHLKKVAGPD